MQNIVDFWKTAIGKVAILGGGGVLGLLSLCFACTICGTLFGDSDSSRQISEATRNIVSFSTEEPTPEPTTTLEPSPTPEPTATPMPIADAPEPTPTSTPMPEPTNVPEENQPPIVTAGDSNINVRSGPGTDYDVVGTLSAGQSLEIVGRNSDSSWWQVSAPDGLCWVSAGVVTSSNVDDTIPIVEVPPPPVQPTPTEVSPQPTNPPSSTGHTFSGDEVDPPWWPCDEGQIKGNRNSMKYHSPGGQFYAKTYDDVQCFNTAAEAEAAGFVASKR